LTINVWCNLLNQLTASGFNSLAENSFPFIFIDFFDERRRWERFEGVGTPPKVLLEHWASFH
jgi:hypothetical protein